MPLWFIKFLLVFIFVPPITFGLALLALAATYMQVMDKKGEDGDGTTA